MQCILNKGAERKSAKMKKNLKVLSIAILAGSLAAAGVVTATYFGGGLKNALPMHAEESNTMMIRVSAADIAAGHQPARQSRQVQPLSHPQRHGRGHQQLFGQRPGHEEPFITLIIQVPPSPRTNALALVSIKLSSITWIPKPEPTPRSLITGRKT